MSNVEEHTKEGGREKEIIGSERLSIAERGKWEKGRVDPLARVKGNRKEKVELREK